MEKSQKTIVLFNDQKIRRHWDEEKEMWYFSVIDVIAVLTESANPRKYWSVLKTRLKKEGSQVTTNCSQLKLESSGGKDTSQTWLTRKHFFDLFNPYPLQKLSLSSNGWVKQVMNV